MRVKIFMGMALLMAAVLTLTSCGKDESFASKQRAERKAVEKFIKERGIEVLHRYPANGVFGKNQYYLIDDGLNEGKVYLHVIDSGNGNRAVQGRTDVLMRCSGEYFFSRDTAIPFNTFVNEAPPIEFVYGTAQYVSSRGRFGAGNNVVYNLAGYYLSPGVESALRYVGENATVSLIVCFVDGSLQQLDKYEPIFYDRVTFRFGN